MRLSQALRDRGLLVPAIRPPTVPEGEACLRISLTYGHTPEMVARLVEALRDWTRSPLPPGEGRREGTVGPRKLDD